MSIKDLFKKPAIIQNSSTSSYDVESRDYTSAKIALQKTFIPQVNFASASNFAKYGSAYEYYTQAIERIYDNYPYDGSEKEKIYFELSSSYLDKWIFDYKYPKTTGHALLGTTGYPGSPTTVGDYGSPGTPEYILIQGGLHTASSGMSGKPLYKTFDKSIKYEHSKNRLSGLRTNPISGSTIEFWMHKNGYNATKTATETVFDLWNGYASSSANYGRMSILMKRAGHSTSKASPFYVTFHSGTSGTGDFPAGGFETQIGDNIGSLITTPVMDWAHYAFSFVSESNGVKVRLYENGTLNDTITLGSVGANEFGGIINAHIGSLISNPSGNVYFNAASSNNLAGYGKLSASIDDFRFWKTRRTSQQIYDNWYRHVGGGTNTDDSNIDLGVYYKFNEGITGITSNDSIALDYSGRLSDGNWYGYNSGARSTDSGFTLSGLVSSEPSDPIMYSAHSSVSSLLSEMQSSGSLWDENNPTMLYNTLPQWIREEDEGTNSNVKYLFQIIANYFDTLHAQITEIPNLKSKTYPSASFKALPFADQLLKDKNLNAPNLFVNANVLEKFGSRDYNQITYEKDLTEVKNLIYTNIYNNLENIYKSKGTERSIRNMLRCFGIDDEIVKINLYTDGGTHTFKDNIKHSSINKKYINFHNQDYFSATIFSTTSSINSNTFITGSGYQGSEKYSAFTAEVDIIVPKKTSVYNAAYFNTPFISSSIFGMHEPSGSQHGASPPAVTDYSWDNFETASFQVYLVRDKLNSNNAKFVLESADGTVQLSSETFNNIYDNQRWNLAVRVKPDKYPLIGNYVGSPDESPTYAIEFYGVHSSFEDATSEFSVSQPLGSTAAQSALSGSGFLSNSRRFYCGAHLQNFTGSVLQKSDVKIGGLRYYKDYLSNDIIKQHNLDPSNYGLKESYKSSTLFANGLTNVHVPTSDLTALNWDFSTVSGSSANGLFEVEDISSGSSDTVYGWIDNIIRREHKGRAIGFGAAKTNFISNEYIFSSKKELPEISFSSNTVKIKGDQENNFIEDEDVSDNFFSLEKSMYQVISEEMLNMFSSVREFNNLIGKNIDKYRPQYKNLDFVRRIFFEKVSGSMDLDTFTGYFKWIDTSISRTIEQLFPVSARFSSGISDVIDSHILERNKYQNKLPLLTTYSSIETSIKGQGELDYNWRIGHAPVGWTETNVSGTAGTTQGDSCLWQKERNIRTDITDRETIRKSIVNDNNASSKTFVTEDGTTYQGSTYAIRRFSKPYKMRQDLNPAVHGGINYPPNKDRDIIHNFVQIHGNKTTTGLPKNVIVVGHGPGQGITETRKCNDITSPPALKKEKYIISANPGKYSTGAGPHYPHESTNYLYSFKDDKLPMTILSSSVTGGYHAVLTRGYRTGSSFVNLHSDTVSPTNEIPMQGPFPRNWVGGHQHRHVDLNRYDALRIDGDTGLPTPNYLDSTYTREEAWQILFVDATSTDGAFGFVGADFGGPYPDQTKKYATRYREERAKRPLNIKNIKTQTDGGTLFSLGNYKETYEILGISGRHENNLYLRRNPDISNYLAESIYSVLPKTTNPMTLIGQNPYHDGNVFGKHNNNRQPNTQVVTAVAATASFTVSGIRHLTVGAVLEISSSNDRGYQVGGSSDHYNISTGSTDQNFYDALESSIESNSGFAVDVVRTSATSAPAPFVKTRPGGGLPWRNFMSGTYGTVANFNPSGNPSYGGFTFAAWVYISSSHAGTAGTIYSQKSPDGIGYGRQIFWRASGQNVEFRTNYTDSGNKHVLWASPNLSSHKDSWFHLAVAHTCSGISDGSGDLVGDCAVYVNGVAQTLSLGGNTLSSPTMNRWSPATHFIFNQDSGSTAGENEFKAGLREVTIWNTNLRADHALSLYNCSSHITASTVDDAAAYLKIYYPLSSSNGNAPLEHNAVFLDIVGEANLTASVNISGNVDFQNGPEHTKSSAVFMLTASADNSSYNGSITVDLDTCNSFSSLLGPAGGVAFVPGRDIVISASTPLINGERNKTVISSRFSAPGGIEVNSVGYLDAYAREYSVYNSLNYRNLSVRSSGSGEAGTIRLNDQNDNRVGLKEHLRRHCGQFGYDSIQGSASAEGYVTIPNSHKIQRNTSRRVMSSSTPLVNPVFNSFNDNSFVSRPIPQSDFQYSWITASLGGPAGDASRIQRNALKGATTMGLLEDTSFSGLGSADFTVSLWWYAEDINTDGFSASNRVYFYDGSDARHVIMLGYSGDDGAGTARVYQENDAGSNDYADFATYFKKGNWYHVVIHLDVGDLGSGGPRLWLNGAEILLPNPSGYSAVGGSATTIDKVQVMIDDEGAMQDLVFWNKLLSDSEIEEIYNNGDYMDPSTHSAVGNIVSWFKLGYEEQWASYSPPSGSGDTLKGTITIPDAIGSNEFTLTEENEFTLIPKATGFKSGDYTIHSGKQRIYGYAPRDGILSSSISVGTSLEGYETGYVPAITFPSASEIYGE